ncbi:MAG: family 10 glycosylhydrolase [Bacteroidota bacterium]
MLKKLCFLLVLTFTSCGIFNVKIPQPKTEFRGVWVATVVNIDWPKSGFDALEKQKSDYLDILDFYSDLNFNAVIVQIRTAGDAFYPSNCAPWSRFLTGKEGTSPKLNYDPLPWMIKEAHLRGMEFHAWLNPYRATFDDKIEVLSETHDYNLHPDWMIKYGKKYYYNPGLPQVQEHLVSIMDEVVRNYDIDAVHFDDYFYPYKITGEVFNDSVAFATHALPQQSLDDWRRSNVDSLVKNIHSSIKEKKPWVQFGISPFGVWKNKSTDPKGSDTKAGQTTYEDLYADPLTWMKNGWIDYLVPQVYWSMDLPVASHRKIMAWWANNTTNTNLYMGNGAYKIRNNTDKAWKRKKELPHQLLLARNTDKVQGNVLFSAKSLQGNNTDVVRYLKRKYYRHIALPPVSPLADNQFLGKVRVLNMEENTEHFKFRVEKSEEETKRYVLVYAAKKMKKLSSENSQQIVAKIKITKENSFSVAKDKLKGKKHIALTFIDRFGRESDSIVLHLDQIHSYDTKR